MLDKFFQKLEQVSPARFRWIFSHEGVKRYFANASWMFFGQLLFLLFSFFIGAWIARYLGPAQYGVVSYVVAFAGLFSFISALGLDGILNRELVKHPERRDELLGTAFRLKIFGAAIAFTVVVLAAFIVPGGAESAGGGQPNYLRALIIMYSLSFFLQAPYVINTYFYSQVKAKESIKAQLAAAIISSLLKVGLILAGGGIIWLLVIYVLDSLWFAMFLVRFYRSQGFKLFTWRFRPELAKTLWRDSWPLMLSSAAAFIYLRIDQVMVGRMMGDSAVGIYAASVKLTEIFYFIPGVICGSLFPAIVNARKTGREVYQGRLRNLYFLIGVLGLLVATPIALLSGPLVNFIFGVDYLAAAPVLRLYIWSSLGLFLGSVVYNQLTVENRTREIFRINLLAMVINVGLNFYLIPRLGLIGAALATLAAYSVAPLWLGGAAVWRRRDRV